MLDDFTLKIGQPLVKEGVVIRRGLGGRPEVVILGFIPADQRKLSYNFVFGLALTIMKIAERHGGRPYATGMYFTGKARCTLGDAHVAKLKAFKARVDHLPGRARELLRHADARRRALGSLCRDDEAEHPGGEGRRGRHDDQLLPGLRHDVAQRLPAVGEEGGHRLRHHHIGRASGVYEPPRDMIKAIPNVTFVEMAHNHECAHCCGSVLTLLKEPQVAAGIGRSRLDEAADAGADKVLALCPCCEFQLRVSAEATHSPVEVVDLAHFAAEALGFTLPDPHPEVRAQWAVFEAMIKLMGTMWPELIDAMPLGMGRMMRVMGKVDGALDAMRPMFPLLFPRLLPLMLPKVMIQWQLRIRYRGACGPESGERPCAPSG